MGEVLLFEPPRLHFPIGYPFEVKDTFNKGRGCWWYRDMEGEVRGPFSSRVNAWTHMTKAFLAASKEKEAE